MYLLLNKLNTSQKLQTNNSLNVHHITETNKVVDQTLLVDERCATISTQPNLTIIVTISTTKSNKKKFQLAIQLENNYLEIKYLNKHSKLISN